MSQYNTDYFLEVNKYPLGILKSGVKKDFYTSEKDYDIIGKRYVLYVFESQKIALDFSLEDKELESYFLTLLKQKYTRGINRRYLSPLTPKEVKLINGYYITEDKSESVAIEATSKKQIKNIVDKFFIEYNRDCMLFNTIEENFEYYRKNLYESLKRNGVSLSLERYHRYVTKEIYLLSLGTKYTFGLAEWEYLSDKDWDNLKTKLDKGVKEFNKLNTDGIIVEWYRSEKASLDFNFYPNKDRKYI